MFFLLYVCLNTLLVVNVYGAAIESSSHLLSEDLTTADRDILNYLNKEASREKRSHDLLDILKAKLAEGIKSKLGQIASSSAHLSGGSSGKHYKHYEPPHEVIHDEIYDAKSFDFWDLQKSILNTLLQAAKAIKGGLIAIKGQLIKGSGYLISAKGKLISAKGEAVTTLGKNIASSAILIPKPHHVHIEHSAPAIEYGPSPHIGHAVEHTYDSYPHHTLGHSGGYIDHAPNIEELKNHLPRGLRGLIVLQKMPQGHKDVFNGNDGAHSTHSSLEKPFKIISGIKSFLSSSSHKEHEPVSHTSVHLDEDIHQNYDVLHEQSHNLFDTPLLPTPLAPISDHESFPFYKEHPLQNFDPNLKYEEHDIANIDNSLKHKENVQPKPPSTNYGVPFEDEHLLHDPRNVNSNNLQSSDLVPNHNPPVPQNLETYEPLKLPNPYPPSLPVNLSILQSQPTPALQKFENFPSYPIDVADSYGNLHNLDNHQSPYQSTLNAQMTLLRHFQKLGPLSELEVSGSEKKPYFSKRPPNRYRNKYSPSKSSKPSTIRHNRFAPEINKNKQSSHARIVSRPKRPQALDRDKSMTFTTRT